MTFGVMFALPLPRSRVHGIFSTHVAPLIMLEAQWVLSYSLAQSCLLKHPFKHTLLTETMTAHTGSAQVQVKTGFG